MSRKSSLNNKSRERLKIKFLGLECQCTNPSWKTIIILVILLIFFAGLAVWVPHIIVLKWLSG